MSESFERTIKVAVIIMAISLMIIAGIFIHTKYEEETLKARLTEAAEKANADARAQAERERESQSELESAERNANRRMGTMDTSGDLPPGNSSKGGYPGPTSARPAITDYQPGYDPVQGHVSPEDVANAEQAQTKSVPRRDNSVRNKGGSFSVPVYGQQPVRKVNNHSGGF